MNDIIFVKLFVHDLEAMAEFYTNVFRLKESNRIRYTIAEGPNEGVEVDEIYMDTDSDGPGAAKFVLLQYLDGRPAANWEVMIGFSTDDLPALIERVDANKGRVTHGPDDYSTTGPDGQVLKGQLIVVEDPEGHLTEIVGTPKPE